jgi:hypothetical protein
VKSPYGDRENYGISDLVTALDIKNGPQKSVFTTIINK